MTKYILNLDPSFIPFISYSAFTQTIQVVERKEFSSGIEPHIKLSTEFYPFQEDDEILISARFKTHSDLLTLFLATDALRGMNARNIKVFISFLPEGRQDRRMNPGEPLSVKVIANLINAQNYNSVILFDPHSDVSSSLINNCKEIKNYHFVKLAIDKIYKTAFTQDESWKVFDILSPDTGAYKKIFPLCKEINYFGTVIVCNKIRELSDGKITKLIINCGDLQGKDIIIIDDICDYGNTFIKIAEELKATKNPGKLHLIISHKLLCGGFAELFKWFETVTCTDSMRNEEEYRKQIIDSASHEEYDVECNDRWQKRFYLINLYSILQFHNLFKI